MLATVKFTEGGLVVYGALIGATLSFCWFTWRHRLPALALADLIAPSLLVGLAFGRIGCLLNGCCYGGEATVPWAISFPQESPAYMDQVGAGRFFGLRLSQNADGGSGVVVTEVEVDSAASRAGLAAGENWFRSTVGRCKAWLPRNAAQLATRPTKINQPRPIVGFSGTI